MDKWYLRNRVTVSDEQRKFIEDNIKKMGRDEIAKSLSITYNKLKNNLRAMGLTKRNPAKVVQMNSEFFDVEEFAKYYK